MWGWFTSGGGGQKRDTKKRAKGVAKKTAAEQTPKMAKIFGSRLTALNGTPPGQNMYDVCAYFIHCPKHNKIAVSTEEKNHYVWLPFISLPTSRTWTDGCLDGANIVLSGGDANKFVAFQTKPAFEESHSMQILRLQLPQTQKFNIRLIYYIKLKPDFQCCEQTKRLS